MPALFALRQSGNAGRCDLEGRGGVRGWEIIINKMNDEQDEFLVEPEIEEVQDIKVMEEAKPILEKQVEQSKNVSLKMVEIPRAEEEYRYRPFRLEREESQAEQDDGEGGCGSAESPFLDCYARQQCVYQRFHNEQFNKINDITYFSGAFLHRNIFLDGNYSQTFEMQNVAKLYYEQPSSPLPAGAEEDLLFDSHFQSGNLFAAFKMGDLEYDLVMSNDLNSKGNNQWFYFAVERMKVDREYTLNVVNFTKSDSLFNYGMAPAVYSLAENKGVLGVERGWKRQGKDVSYKKGIINRQNSRRMYYKLTFKLSPMFEKDRVYVAHSYPYTLQKLSKFISDKALRFKQVIIRMNVGRSHSKRVIQGLMIGQSINKKRDNRKAIIIMARQHPGETQGSFVCEGVVERLLAKCKQAEFLLKNYIIYVIPMANPDGVVFGHYRTNLAGKDLNRNWNASEKDQNCPEVVSIKGFIQQVSKEREIRFIIDLHGHSKKLNSFFYGNPCPQNPDTVRIFPYACSKLHQGIQFLDCTFSTDQCKKKAARVYLSFFYRLIHVYTFESSFYAYFREGRKVEFTPKEYRQVGGVLINALFLQLEHEIRFQQSFQFNLKKNSAKEYLSSPFVKMLAELKTSKQLLEQGSKWESGSESRPQQNEVKNEEMECIKPVRPTSTPSSKAINCTRAIKVSRRGGRDGKQISFNKPSRNIKFLQINKVNSVLPDQYQMGLQPIKKREVKVQVIKPSHLILAKIGTAAQTQPRAELKNVELNKVDIQSSVLSSSMRVEVGSQRKYSSVIKSNNRNFIFKFDVFGSTIEHEGASGQRSAVQKNAYSQTLITYSKQAEKAKTSQALPLVGSPEVDEKRWLRNNSLRVQTPLRSGSGMRREADKFFDKMMKKLMDEKQLSRSEQFSGKFMLEKPLSIKKKEISKK